MVFGFICLVVFLILMAISISLRIASSGLRTANRALEDTRDNLKQQDLGRDSIDFTASMVRKMSKLFSRLAKGVLALGSIGAILTGVITIILIVAVIIVGVVLNDNLTNAVRDRQNKSKDECATEAVGGYWEELDFCFEEGVTKKVWGNSSAVKAVESAQYKLIHSPEHYFDDYGFGRVKDEDLGVDFYTIAWSKALFTEVGEKYRMTLKKEDGTEHAIYVIMVDQRQDGHSAPDGKNKSPICYPAGGPAIAEFYIDSNKTKQNHPEEVEQGGFINMGNVECIKATDSDHDLHGYAVKIEHYLGPTGTEHKSQSEYDTDAKVIKEKYSDGDSGNRKNACVKKNDTVSIDGRVIWVGDSRTVGLELACKANKQWDESKDITNEALAKGSMGLPYFRDTSIPALKSVVKDDDTIVINYGVNSLGGNEQNAKDMAKSYSDLTNQLAEDYPKAKVVFMSVNPIVDSGSTMVPDANVVAFNKEIQNLLSSKVTYVDTYTKLKESEWLLKETDSEGLHYSVAQDGYYHCYGMIYDSIRNGGSSSVSTNGVSINFDTRYYAKAGDGVYGSPLGISELPESVSTPFQMTTTTYALGRAWQKNNPNGLCPLPENYADYLANKQTPKWSENEKVKGIFTERADIPIEHAILSYRLKSGISREAFIEYYDAKTGYVQISEVSGKQEKYAGYTAKYYTSVESFLKKKNATINCMFQPVGDGH